MELEVVGEDVLAEPDFGVGVEQTFVVVVGDSAAVLHFTDHVPHGRPRHALHMQYPVSHSTDTENCISLVGSDF